MFINDLPPALFKAVLRATDGAPPSIFAKGEVVEGTVLKSISPEQALVRLGGVDLMAQTKIRLLDGQTITGVVEKTSPLTVNLLQGKAGKEEKIAELVRLLLPGKKPLADALSTVTTQAGKPNLPPAARQALESLAPKLAEAVVKDLASLTPEGTKSVIKQSGLFFEAGLKEIATAPRGEQPVKTAQLVAADLKGQLAATLKTLEGEIARLTKELALPPPPTRSAPAPTASPLPTATLTADRTAPPPASAFETSSKIEAHKNAPPTSADPKSPAPQSVADPRLDQLAQLRESARSVREGMHTIELNQLLNSGAASREGQASAPGATAPPYLFQLPFTEGGLIKNARVYVDPDGGGGNVRDKKKGETGVVFMLDMTALGPVRVDTRIAKERIAGSVYVGSDPVAAYLEGRLPDLVAPLREAGYQVTFDVRVASPATLSEELESSVPLTPQGLINVKA